MSAFKRITSSVANSPWAIIVWGLSIMMIFHGTLLFREDYSTTVAFYSGLPTHKIHNGTASAVAFIVQFGPLWLGYIFADRWDSKNHSSWWLGVLATSVALVDMYTDALYKSGGDSSIMPIALLESFVVYTIGVEFLLVLAIGVIFNLTRPAFTQLVRLVKSVFVTVLDVLDDGHINQSAKPFNPNQNPSNQSQKGNNQPFKPMAPPGFSYPPLQKPKSNAVMPGQPSKNGGQQSPKGGGSYPSFFREGDQDSPIDSGPWTTVS